MSGRKIHVDMFKLVSTTIAYSAGVGVTFGSMIVALAAMLQ